MILRPYQEAAVDAIRAAFNRGVKRPLVCLPTGSGKTPTICTLIHRLAQRFPDEQFVCTVNTQELVDQLASSYRRISGTEPAVYSASLKRKELGRVIFGQIQSIYRKACDIGRIKLLVVDECDRIPVDGDGQYRAFIEEASVINPELRICGFTATPYRMRSGLVYGEGQPFDELVYDADVRTLIDSKFLSNLVSKDGGRPDLSGVGIRNGDYAANQLEAVMSEEDTVKHAVEEIIRYGSDRKAWLVFCSGIKHATLVSNALRERGIDAPIIEGNTPDAERKKYISDFRNKTLRCLVNVNVLSIGFDAPHVDLLALLRPTLSPGLYYQQIGRGLRIADGKENCLILDLAGNIAKHGPIDTLNARIKAKRSAKEKGEAPTKTCPQCSEIVHASVQTCPSCQFKFPPPKIVKHQATAFNESPLSGTMESDVTDVMYNIQRGGGGKPDTFVMIYYNCGQEIMRQYFCPHRDHNHWARKRFHEFIIRSKVDPDSGKSFRCDGDTLYMDSNGQSIEIDSASSMLPHSSCLLAPIRIKYRRSPSNTRYFDLLSREY